MLKQFFILCSGADSKILNTCSEGEQNKYVGVGATVFFTAVMAFIASAYALYTVFDNIFTSLFFGFIWGLLIFNLDRFIVSTIKKSREHFIVLSFILSTAFWMNITNTLFDRNES